jgi:hypothetical protein
MTAGPFDPPVGAYRQVETHRRIPEGLVSDLTIEGEGHVISDLFTEREFWTVIHGLVLGTLFLLAFAGGLAGLWSLRERYLTTEGIAERSPRMLIGTTIMAVVAWLTVLTGTFIIYPWYRAAPPEGTTDLEAFPRSFLLGNDVTAFWHTFGMEWKEHVAWLAPILATAVAFIVIYYGPQLIRHPEWRRLLIVLFTLAFAAAGIAGLFGAFITKAAPIL